MTNENFTQLCRDIQEIAESLEVSEPACDFEENEVAFDNENYSELWSDRS